MTSYAVENGNKKSAPGSDETQPDISNPRKRVKERKMSEVEHGAECKQRFHLQVDIKNEFSQ